MREIKFRFYYKNKLLDTLSLREISEGGFHWADGVVVVEFTGLQDKNGKEIYGGDVVKHYGHSIEDDDLYLRVGVISYIEDRFIGIGDRCHFYLNVGRDIPKSSCEVIGNIYENPELLGEDKND